MKTVMVMLLMYFLPVEVEAQKVKDSSMIFASVTGFGNIQDIGDGFDLGWTRLRPVVGVGKLSLDFEWEFAGLDNRVEGKPLEWFSQGRLIYRPDATTAIMVGRNFRPFGYSAFTPVLIKTAKYPNAYPYKGGYYAYGIRVDRKVSVGALGIWNAQADLTAAPGGYQELDLENPEASINVSQKHGVVSYWFAGEFSREYARGGTQLVVELKHLTASGGLYGNNDQKKALSGLFLLEGSKLFWFRPHVQYYSGTNGESTWTEGLTAIVKTANNLEFKAIVDYNGREFFLRSQIYLF